MAHSLIEHCPFGKALLGVLCKVTSAIQHAPLAVRICQAAHERGRLPPHTPTGHVPEVRGTSHLQLRVVPCQVLQPVRIRAPVAARGGAPAAEGIVVLHLEGQRRVGLHRQSAAAVVWGLRQGVQAPPVHRKSLCNKFGG